MLKNKCCLYVTISILFFSITICNLLIESPSYISLCHFRINCDVAISLVNQLQLEENNENFQIFH